MSLSTSIRSGRINRVREAVARNGISILHTPGSTTTRMLPLHLAVDFGHLGIVQYMLEQGSRPNARDAHGRTPLHLAATRGHMNIVRTLLVSGAGVNFTNRRRQTPLHIAAQNGHLGVVRLLLTRGASLSINRRDENGKTPIHYAVEGNHRGVVNFLGNRGARLDIANRNGRTPLDVARSDSMRRLLRSVDQSRATPQSIETLMSGLALETRDGPPSTRRNPNTIPPIRRPTRNRSPTVRVIPSRRIRNRMRVTPSVPTAFRPGNARHRTNSNTTFVNVDFVPVDGIANIPANKRAYLNVDVNANGTIKHVYHRDGLVAWIQSQGGRAPSPFTRRPVTYSDVRML